MKLQNKSKRTYVHSYLNDKFALTILDLKPGEIKDIPDNIAKSWLKSNEIVEYVAPQEAKALEDENAKLKKELKKLKETKKTNKTNKPKTRKNKKEI